LTLELSKLPLSFIILNVVFSFYFTYPQTKRSLFSMQGMQEALNELATLGPLLREQGEVSRDWMRVCGLSQEGAGLASKFVRFFEVLRARPERFFEVLRARPERARAIL